MMHSNTPTCMIHEYSPFFSCSRDHFPPSRLCPTSTFAISRFLFVKSLIRFLLSGLRRFILDDSSFSPSAPLTKKTLVGLLQELKLSSRGSKAVEIRSGCLRFYLILLHFVHSLVLCGKLQKSDYIRFS